MDDEEFDDLLAGVDLFKGSSQGSLTSAAANLHFCDDSDVDDEQCVRNAPASPPSSVELHDPADAEVQRTIAQEIGLPNQPFPDEVATRNDGQHPSGHHPPAKPTVLDQIEGVFEGIADALRHERHELSITLKIRASKANAANTVTGHSVSGPAIVTRANRICFPGKTAEEAWRFTVIIRILEMMHEALRNEVVLSKRDIYYRDPALFGRQAVVDRYVDDIAFTFGVTRSMLNVTAVAKGLVAGAIQFCHRDGAVVNAAGEREGMLVPNLRYILSVDMSNVKWILVIEKEANFRSIAASDFWNTVSSEGIILTGKGYPDIATRAVLHFLSTPSPQNGFSAPRVFGLVDFDPDGLAILSVYKHGSLALSHENADLRVPQMQWLGLTTNDLKAASNDEHSNQSLLNLSARDRRKAVKMIERYNCNEEDEADVLTQRNALQMMLMLNVKAELQLLDARPKGTVDLLNTRLRDI